MIDEWSTEELWTVKLWQNNRLWSTGRSCDNIVTSWYDTAQVNFVVYFLRLNRYCSDVQLTPRKQVMQADKKPDEVEARDGTTKE